MTIGTQTKSDGSYRFTVPAARATGQAALLTVRLQGFKPKSVTVTLSPGTINTDFSLESQAVVLQQLVITGEGTITTNEKLGAVVNNVGAEDITKSNEQNLTEALAGKAPNVAITSESGDPGSSVNIQIRGIKSFSGDGQPLFVVDGVPVDNQSINVQGQFARNAEQGTVAPNRISDINPNDVESVTILKGSAAAAIYGARAAQGVVLITTKSGKAGKTEYSLHSSYSFDKVTHGYPLQRTYGQGNNGFLADNGVLNTGLPSDTDAFSSSHSWGQPLAAGTVTYDHFGEMFETGHVADNNLSVSGGDDRRSFFLSGGINNNNGFVTGPNDSVQAQHHSPQGVAAHRRQAQGRRQHLVHRYARFLHSARRQHERHHARRSSHAAGMEQPRLHRVERAVQVVPLSDAVHALRVARTRLRRPVLHRVAGAGEGKHSAACSATSM